MRVPVLMPAGARVPVPEGIPFRASNHLALSTLALARTLRLPRALPLPLSRTALPPIRRAASVRAIVTWGRVSAAVHVALTDQYSGSGFHPTRVTSRPRTFSTALRMWRSITATRSGSEYLNGRDTWHFW